MPTTGQIAKELDATLIGPADMQLTGINALAAAGPGEVTFIRDPSHAAGWETSNASAVLIGPKVELAASADKAILRVKDADIAVARVLELFAPPKVQPDLGVHPSAVIHPTARVGKDVRIGPLCVIGAHATIGDRCILQASVTIMDNSHLGDDTELHPGCVIRERCTLGQRCILHPNVNIGADGFGFRPSPDGKSIIKIPQIGGVIIGNDVELGAGTCVDRAKFDNTTIGDGTKIDNLCQIAHNCRIGKQVIIAGGTSIGGSVTIEDHALIAGGVAIKDQVTVGKGARLAACCVAMNDVPPNVTWGGYPAQEMRLTLREIATVRKLPDMIKQWRSAGRI